MSFVICAFWLLVFSTTIICTSLAMRPDLAVAGFPKLPILSRAVQHVEHVGFLLQLLLLIAGFAGVMAAIFLGFLLGPFSDAHELALIGPPVFAVAVGLATAIFDARIWAGQLVMQTAHGSAEFMDEPEIREQLEKNSQGLILGDVVLPQSESHLLRYAGDAHLLTIAPTRSGKGVGSIIPNLLTYEGSVLVIDPKGENARVTARKRHEFGTVHVLDPFNVSGVETASYNPLARINSCNPDATDDAAALADALVVRGSDKDSYWDDEGASLLEGIILFVALHEREDRRHLSTVRELVTLDMDRFSSVLEIMQECGGLIERTANRFLSKSDNEASSVRSSAQRHTKFLDSARMEAVMGSAGGLDFRDLKRETGTTVYLCLPPDRMDTYSRWLRLMVNEALLDMAIETAHPASPVLFLLDEFSSLGRLQSIERAMGLMAGYGMTIWPFLQDLSQLKKLYGDAALTFFANSGAVQIFSVNDLETAKQISETIGQTTLVINNAPSGRSLLTPDEIMRLDPSEQIVMLQGRAPALIGKLRYYDDQRFAGDWDQDPRRAA